MNGTFVKALWGDERIERLSKVRYEIVKYLKQWQFQPRPVLYCAFGQDNYDHLSKAGVSSVLLSPNAVVDFDGVGERYPAGVEQDKWGRVNYGYSIWRHKLDAIKAALEQYEAAVWLDWDTLLLEPLPEDFWGRMAQGPPIQTTLTSYRTGIWCPWRGDCDKVTGCGGFLYLRDKAILQRMVEVYKEHPLWIDQDVASYVIDELTGGWKGWQYYQAQGYEPYCHVSRSGVTKQKDSMLFFSRQGSKSDPNWKPPEL